MRRLYVFFISICCTGSLLAEVAGVDTLSSFSRLYKLTSATMSFRGAVWDNPADYKRFSDFSFTDISLYGSGAVEGEASLIQKGDKNLGWGAKVKSFIPLNNRESVWGAASYDNRHTKSVRWNDNADWDIVYPYVTGDSVGGFMQSETYYFMGGYAHDFNRFTLGAEVSYRAVSSFRDMDPRPQNVVSDLYLNVGASYRLGNYTLGIGGLLQSYKQTGKISFLADKGAFSVYQMLGMGVGYMRFAGSYTASLYKATRLGGNLNIMPHDNCNGFSATLGYNRLTLTKELPGANNFPMVNVTEHNTMAQMAYIASASSTRHWGARLTAVYVSRKGLESIAGDATGNTYTVIGYSPGYACNRFSTLLTAMMEDVNISAWSWNVSPSIGFNSFTSKYASVSRHADYSEALATLNAQVQRQFNRIALTLAANGGYTANVSSSSSFAGLDADSSVAQMLKHDFEFSADSYWNIGAKLRADYALRQRGTIYVALNAQRQQYKISGNAYQCEASIGALF